MRRCPKCDSWYHYGQTGTGLWYCTRCWYTKGENKNDYSYYVQKW